MRLFLIRHGLAEDFASSRRDFDRRLTEEGRKQMKRVAAGLDALELKIERIYTSPYPRARETAEAVAEATDLRSVLQITEALACGAGTDAIRRLLRDAETPRRVLLVGHEPEMSELLAELTGGIIRMKKASLACLEASPDLAGAELRWLLEAQHLERIGCRD